MDAAREREGLPAPTPPITIIGVEALFGPSFIVEIDATAVLGWGNIDAPTASTSAART